MTKTCKVCKVCQVWEKDTEEYATFTQGQIETGQLRYEIYIGDGDSKAYSSVVNADPYPGLTVQKGECIGHIQKRVGPRLRRLRKKESLGGAGRLSDKAINKLQYYFGIAIRKINSSVISMKKAIGAVLFQCCEATDPVVRYMFCDKNERTW